jgi:intracellular septation protein
MSAMLLEFFPLLAFFVAYKWSDIYVATAILIASSLIQLVWFRVREGRFKPLRLGVFLALLVFGGLTIWLRDPDFVKWKVSIVLSLLALMLMLSDRLFKKPLVRTLLAGADSTLENVPYAVWQQLTLVWSASYLAQAVANYIVAFHWPEGTWVNFKVWGLTLANLLTVVITVVILARHTPVQDPQQERD